jgi:hypothetical protein
MKANVSALFLSLATAATTTLPTASMSMATTDTYTADDFSGLFKYLDIPSCDGPALLNCEVDVTVTENDAQVEAYLGAVDLCLYRSKCLSYHSILIYK